jgi:hypothetical protein
LEAFGGGTEGGPPAGASFFEKEEFGTVLGADQSGRDDLGVIEDEKVAWVEERGEVPDGVVGDFASGAAEE